MYNILGKMKNMLPILTVTMHSVLLSLSVRPSVPLKVVGILCMQLLLQFYANSFETLQVFRSWSEDVHIVWI